jgi:DNA-binding transcriptional regulator YiaG
MCDACRDKPRRATSVARITKENEMATKPHTAATFTALRQRLGLSQSAMGEAIGLSQAQVSRIESGERQITPMLQKILAGMNKKT